MNAKTISSRQTAVLASVMLFANKILVLPSLLYEYAKADSIFIMAEKKISGFELLSNNKAKNGRFYGKKPLYFDCNLHFL